MSLMCGFPVKGHTSVVQGHTLLLHMDPHVICLPEKKNVFSFVMELFWHKHTNSDTLDPLKRLRMAHWAVKWPSSSSALRWRSIQQVSPLQSQHHVHAGLRRRTDAAAGCWRTHVCSVSICLSLLSLIIISSDEMKMEISINWFCVFCAVPVFVFCWSPLFRGFGAEGQWGSSVGHSLFICLSIAYGTQ